MSRHKLKFDTLPDRFAICRLSPDSAIPPWANQGAFVSITRTADELSIICAAANVPADLNVEREWICFKLEGPIPFTQTGVVTSFVQPLSDNAIPIFVLSTYDTDYILIKEAFSELAFEILTQGWTPTHALNKPRSLVRRCRPAVDTQNQTERC